MKMGWSSAKCKWVSVLFVFLMAFSAYANVEDGYLDANRYLISIFPGWISASGNHIQGRYRSRKGKPAVNILGVCDSNMNFIYVLTGWEGSAADGRVLRNAIERPNGFRVPRGGYYLCDAGYTNGEGFLAPYRGVRYHLKEWGVGNARPQNYKELYNMRHSKARNCIERAFGILKARWAILRSQSFYPIETQNDIILACCLLHNYCRIEFDIDPVEVELENEVFDDSNGGTAHIHHIETSPQWSAWRGTQAQDMFTHYRH